jgi:hypothetical protein
MRNDIMPAESRDEWATLLSGALNGSRRVDDAAVERAEKALASFDFERVVTRAYVLAGLRRDLNTQSKSESIALVAYNGSHVEKTMRVGVKRRRLDGSLEHQQALYEEMTWAELRVHLDAIEKLLGSLDVRAHAASALLALEQQFPNSIGPEDACRQLGMTVKEFLAA